MQNLVQGIKPSGFLWALAPVEKQLSEFISSKKSVTDLQASRGVDIFSVRFFVFLPSSLSASMLSCS